MAIILPPRDLHSDFDAEIQPCPLQLFCPLQELVAVLQELLPWQEFMPPHLTLAAFAATLPSATSSADEHPANNNVAAAAAKDIPVIFLTVFMRYTPLVLKQSENRIVKPRYALIAVIDARD